MIITANKYAASMGVTGSAISRRIKLGKKLPGVRSISKIGNYYQFTVSIGYDSEENKKKFKKSFVKLN